MATDRAILAPGLQLVDMAAKSSQRDPEQTIVDISPATEKLGQAESRDFETMSARWLMKSRPLRGRELKNSASPTAIGWDRQSMTIENMFGTLADWSLCQLVDIMTRLLRFSLSARG
jgi:hypothetical protein